ncbi:MAG: hypothetical protein C0501_31150 [Isosphaera sp.]|nr:hypothetical protein [Isosphaera sp.]
MVRPAGRRPPRVTDPDPEATMAHDHHDHVHGADASGYFVEQLLTVLVCGLFGFAAVQLYRTGMLDKTLAPQFHLWVLVGGIVVLGLVVVRAVAVWREAGELQAAEAACAADHQHGPECDHGHDHGPRGHDHHDHDHDDHDHDDHDHDDHGHSHDLSWVFARMLVLVFPVLLFFLGLPDKTFSQEAQLNMVGKETEVGGLRAVAAKGGNVFRFNDLNDAAFDPAKRESLEGQSATLEGRFKRLADKQFTLFRLKMTCCASDTVPLKARVIVPQALTGFKDFDWVRVQGRIQFAAVPGGRPGAETYIPVIVVDDIKDVKQAPALNEYEP